jgi:hypothetical protein
VLERGVVDCFLTGFALDQFFRNLREMKLKKVEMPGRGVRKSRGVGLGDVLYSWLFFADDGHGDMEVTSRRSCAKGISRQEPWLSHSD